MQTDHLHLDSRMSLSNLFQGHWIHILRFAPPDCEFPLAMVCENWYKILESNRKQRAAKAPIKDDTLRPSYWEEYHSTTVCRLTLCLPDEAKQWHTSYTCVTNTVPRLKWACANGVTHLWDEVVSFAAAINGNPDVVEHVVVHGTVTFAASKFAAMHGRKEALEVLHKHGKIDAYAFDVACQHNQMHLLRWMIDEKMVCVFACEWAANHGLLEILKYAVEKDCPFKTRMDSIEMEATRGGHVPVLDWLSANGFAFESYSDVLSDLAEAGKLEAMKWFLARGLPWSSRVVHVAKTEKIRRWAIENGCPLPLEEEE